MVSKVVVSTVDQIQNGQSSQVLQSILAHPAAANLDHAEALEELVQAYPQCSIFHALLAKAVQKSDAETAAKALQTAAVYAANREVLFKLIYQPELIAAPKREAVYSFLQLLKEPEILTPDASFMPEILVPDEEVIFLEKRSSAEMIDASFSNEKTIKEEAILSQENLQPEITDAVFEDQNPEAEAASAKTEGNPALSIIEEEAIFIENDLRVEDVALNFVNEPADELVFPTEEATLQNLQPEEEASVRETANAVFISEIDEEVYEEIMAIEDINFEVIKTASPEELQPETKQEITIEELPKLNLQDKAEKDMLSSIASIDYFTFNNRFGQKQTPVADVKQPEAEIPETITNVSDTTLIPAKPNESSAEKEPETVSKYHDDKMPYTFMWWLDKTRKEYAGTYQPYTKVTPVQKADTGLSVGPELHQQYVESIFHTKPPHGLADDTLQTAQPAVKRKEDQLIERFIIEEPHIHPPSNEKLDTENKAKKSSEDGDVLVTETLAKIYLDQMLYHKALDTYQKLLLKFPEKSRYFTDQIELIERKII